MKRIPIKPEKITFKDVEKKIDIEPSYVVGQSYDSAKGDKPKEVGGRKGLDPVRYGDWEQKGRCIDFQPPPPKLSDPCLTFMGYKIMTKQTFQPKFAKYKELYDQQTAPSHDQPPFSTVESVYDHAEGIDNTLGMNYNDIMDLEDADAELVVARNKYRELLDERKIILKWLDSMDKFGTGCRVCGFTPEVPRELNEAISSARKNWRKSSERVEELERKYGRK